MHFTEAALEQAVTQLFAEGQIPHTNGTLLSRDLREVLLRNDLQEYLLNQYGHEEITSGEIAGIIRQLEIYPSSALYDSNKAILKLIADGLVLKREDRSKKDLFIHRLPCPARTPNRSRRR
jgi:type I restriction enzyme, R subunit